MFKSIIIGCGKIAGLYDDMNNSFVYSHARAYQNNSLIDVVCYVDNDESRAKTLANKYCSNHYSSDYKEAIKLYKPDVVSVCTPDSTHFEVVNTILDLEYLPRIIFLEKPACRTSEEFDTLIMKSKIKDVKIVVNHSRRFDNLHQNLKHKIFLNTFGQLIKIDAIYYGGWNHNGVHTIDTLNFLFDDEVVINNIIDQFLSPYQGDFNFDFKCFFKNKKTPIYLTTMNEENYQLFEFDLKFEKARIRIEDFGQRIVYEEKEINEMNENILVVKESPLDISKISPMQNAINIIVSSLKDTTEIIGYQLSDISKTMNLIWEGNQWVK
ncbi:MAG: Gfo/Idh/MocA family oxidoreductase [Arcobacter sp.]|uniref:Gfo/Idh/MocA family protein n=1 Tax=Arcobacter sp. TaxID=1872629 RepID=UPI003C759679